MLTLHSLLSLLQGLHLAPIWHSFDSMNHKSLDMISLIIKSLTIMTINTRSADVSLSPFDLFISLFLYLFTHCFCISILLYPFVYQSLLEWIVSCLICLVLSCSTRKLGSRILMSLLVLLLWLVNQSIEHKLCCVAHFSFLCSHRVLELLFGQKDLETLQ